MEGKVKVKGMLILALRFLWPRPRKALITALLALCCQVDNSSSDVVCIRSNADHRHRCCSVRCSHHHRYHHHRLSAAL